MVLNYDMWQVMNNVQQKIKFQLKWENFDSHIETKMYKEDTKPKGGQLYIRLNVEMDAWAADAREWGHTILQEDETEQFFYSESTVMVKIGTTYLYGNIIDQVQELI